MIFAKNYFRVFAKILLQSCTFCITSVLASCLQKKLQKNLTSFIFVWHLFWKILFIFDLTNKKVGLWNRPGQECDSPRHHRRGHTGARQRATSFLQTRAPNSRTVGDDVGFYSAVAPGQLLHRHDTQTDKIKIKWQNLVISLTWI